MRAEVELTGLHSRSEELIKLTRAYDRGHAQWEQVHDRLKLETAQLIELQSKLRFGFFSDGGLAWQDPLRPLTTSLEGVTSGARYSRWFDTNTFYKKPIITGTVQPSNFIIENFLQRDIAPTVRNWKVTIPGPYTFSELSDNESYDSPEELLRDVAESERDIVDKLLASGIASVQLSEPSLVYRPYRKIPASPVELENAIRAIKTVSDGHGPNITVHTFFGDPEPVLPRLFSLPISGVGFDLYETEPTKLRGKTTGKIALGIVDSRESHIEDPAWIAETARNIRGGIEAKSFVLAPNTDLRYVPRETADLKVDALAKAAALLWEEGP